MPPTSDEYLRYTQDELWVEFYEDLFEAKPEEALDIVEEDSQFVTGDDEYDAFEARWAKGELTDEDVEALASKWSGGESLKTAAPHPDTLDFDFDDEIPGRR